MALFEPAGDERKKLAPFDFARPSTSSGLATLRTNGVGIPRANAWNPHLGQGLESHWARTWNPIRPGPGIPLGQGLESIRAIIHESNPCYNP